MEQLVRIVFTIYDKYHWQGLLIAFFVFDKYVYPWWKRKRGHWIESKSLFEKIDMLQKSIDSHVVSDTASFADAVKRDRDVEEELHVYRATQEGVNIAFKSAVDILNKNLEGLSAQLSTLTNVILQSDMLKKK